MKKILFLCGNNASRSQMAEGIARKELGDRYEVYSAGMQPMKIHPTAVEVMKEVGVDLSRQKSKSINEVPWREMDVIVTLCGTSSNGLPPLPPQVKRLHWPVPDPATMTSHYGFKKSAEGKQAAFKEIRDLLQKKIDEFKQNPS